MNERHVSTEEDSATGVGDDEELTSDSDSTRDSDSASDDETTSDQDGDGEDAESLDVTYPDKLKECHEKLKIYDRRTATDSDPGECHAEAKYPAEFECTRAGVISGFNSSASIKKYMNQQDADGFEIDQCGSYAGGRPIVFFIKKSGSDAELKLSIRVVEPD